MAHKYISAGNHLDIVWLPSNLWTDRVASRYRERVPHVVETDQGTFWKWEGKAQVTGGAILTTVAASSSSGLGASSASRSTRLSRFDRPPANPPSPGAAGGACERPRALARAPLERPWN